MYLSKSLTGWPTKSGIARQVSLALSTVVFSSSVLAADFAVDRRKDQFPTSSGRLIAPIPYSMPGLGKGFFILGHFSNIFSGTSDFTVIKATGDIKGYDANIDEVPLISKHFFLRAELLDLSSVQVNYYKTRGMNSDKDEYSLLDIRPYKQQNYGLNLTFYDRRLTFAVNRKLSEGKFDAFRDPDGNITSTFDEPYEIRNNGTRWSLQADLTDDYQDPRVGLRINLSFQDSPANSKDDADFYVTELDTSYYAPLRVNDTLVFNFFQSDAHVRSKGNLDRDAIAADLNTCDPASAEYTQCLADKETTIDNFVKERSHGTATSLGGTNRLRAFPDSRFSGAHTSTIGIEYRMNFVHEATPINYGIWKDTHTGIQVAFFYELGTVAELTSELWQDTRYVFGSGVRLVTKSGAVYRFDLAAGNEGVQPNLFFYYPWN